MIGREKSLYLRQKWQKWTQIVSTFCLSLFNLRWCIKTKSDRTILSSVTLLYRTCLLYQPSGDDTVPRKQRDIN